jgi:hypothetical protein
MSSPISLAAVRHAKAEAAAGQMSHAKGFAAARVRMVPVVDKAAFVGWWAGLMRRRCGGDAVTISRLFDVTEQTGRNWLAGFSCPLGHHSDLAMALWPGEFMARHGLADFGADLGAVA